MRGPGYTVVVHRTGSVATRQIHVPRWVARVAAIGGAVILVAVLVLAATYGPILAAAARAPLLARRVERLTAENRRVAELARALDEAEARYAQLRGMLGAQIGPPPPGSDPAESLGAADRLYVAPPLLARAPGTADSSLEASGPSVPHLWPLTIPSYRTRGMVVGADSPQETHPGIDLAVPVGSDVLASGGGVVREAGQDSAYGSYVLIQHPRGYQSMYGHLSRLLVAKNDLVRAGQVIALSGNTGRSTAPHLHFEIRRGGQSLDPLTLVREGR